MPPLHDQAAIRFLQERDRPWSVYALGDLAPAFFPQCRWFSAAGEPPTLLLLYRVFNSAVLFTLGPPDRLAPLLTEIEPALPLILHIKPEIVPLLQPRYDFSQLKAMWRMLLDPGRFSPGSFADAEPLGPADLDALQSLYADGNDTGEAPDFFLPAMLGEGAFFGIWQGQELVAAAGTHLVVPQEGVAAVGNIYTRTGHRNRGLAGCVTAAVVVELLRRGLPTIGLNVAQDNVAAQRVYERLGFQRYCPFVEGLATPHP